MTQLRSFSFTDTYDTFRQGVAAYRNARDWTQEKRNKFIRLANERCSEAQSQHHSTLQRQATKCFGVELESQNEGRSTDTADREELSDTDGSIQELSDRIVELEVQIAQARKQFSKLGLRRYWLAFNNN